MSDPLVFEDHWTRSFSLVRIEALWRRYKNSLCILMHDVLDVLGGLTFGFAFIFQCVFIIFFPVLFVYLFGLLRQSLTV